MESRDKAVAGAPWSVAGLTRATARVVSQVDGRPAYGGTPSDDVVAAAIRDLRARGLSVMLYPFVMMDIPAGNALPDPLTGAAGQRAYPWRGELTCAAADDVAAVRAEIAACFGSVSPGAAEWSFRRHILHYARLCAEAGGVDAFLVGSEMRGLTHRRDEAGAFPAALALAQLAADAKAILGPATKISYAADWTEYGARVRNGGADVAFPLDFVWSHPSVDFIGIDVYFPLSDWRHDETHADAQIAGSVHDRAYLASRFGAGEAHDFHYADEAARAAQQRLPITDGARGKPWVFRQKDLVGWWSQPHHARVAGVEAATPTAWAPRSKPIWFVEAGCPSVDLGANAPNVFPDARAPGANLPPFSSGARDDLMQMRAIEALYMRFDARAPGHDASWNPRSPLYDGCMVDPDRIFLWAYDARPFPAFPMLSDTWTDAPAWDTGHWLNGRLESVGLDALVRAILQDALGDADIALPPLNGVADGYVIDRPVSARGALEPLSAWFGFDAVVSAGAIRFLDRRDGARVNVTQDDIAPLKDGSLIERIRADESELPRELSLAFSESEWDYRPASLLSRRLEGGARRVASADLPLVTHRGAAQAAADLWLRDLWTARETARLRLRPGFAALEVGDLVSLPLDGDNLYRILRISDVDAREILCRAVDLRVRDHRPASQPRRAMAAPALPGPARVEILDLALALEDPTPLQHLAAFAQPWPGALALWRAGGAGSFDYLRRIERPALIGLTLDVLPPGPVALFDRAARLRIETAGGALSSAGDLDVLAGRNRLAVRGHDGQWEVLGFAEAELVGQGVWRLARLLRGLGGQEHLAARATPAGATCVLLDDAVVPLASGVAALGLRSVYRLGPADRDHADPAFVEFSAEPGALSLRPYAPVRARARRTAAGVEISFLRRARRDADGWEPLDIPLAEASESYIVEILRDGAPLRRLETSTPLALYPAALETADFGAPQARLACRVAQLSSAVGAGFPLLVDLDVL